MRKGKKWNLELENNEHSCAKEMNGAQRSAEVVGCKNASVGVCSVSEGSTRANGGVRSGSKEY